MTTTDPQQAQMMKNHAAKPFSVMFVVFFPFFERLGVVYFDQQPGGYPAAMVSEQVRILFQPRAKPTARQELRPAPFATRNRPCLTSRLRSTMTKELVREGKLDPRRHWRTPCGNFLQKYVAGRWPGAESYLCVRQSHPPAEKKAKRKCSPTLDGKDKEILLARGGEVLKASGAFGVSGRLRLEPAFSREDPFGLYGAFVRLRFEELRMTARVAAERVQSSRQNRFQLNPMSVPGAAGSFIWL